MDLDNTTAPPRPNGLVATHSDEEEHGNLPVADMDTDTASSIAGGGEAVHNKRRRTSSISEPESTAPLTDEGSQSAMEPRGWQATIEHAVKAIVSIRFSQVAAFDTEGAETSEASGYIVDAERGIILTNR
ncbi:hypothetical protein SYNPS1DRAFT_32009 [Syncephalis pseudoplumigaleata]|uniref:Uncharacterized protein n=1 Tax=Syncephalis pseudoplumigaleata TaxID=1712513 RepID=A0A4P9YTD0_9FUNG|nr:hypothetical protein SYNPS1DRAFT_32009 [Syncephalis pseudoplumigaleata]|eukprot:RKP22401.1 hypothetical protein SYNPS1DRAFT_32009 [Syncephalis pseudoplumigaleata]